MKALTKTILLIILICITSGSAYSQFWRSILSSGNWGVNTGINSGFVASVQFGKGWELEYGAGLEWAPFNKSFYIVADMSYVNQFLDNNSPDNFIFTSNPDKTEMHSNYVRLRYGLKFRVNWWDKKEDRNSYLIANYNYITNFLVKETTDLYHNNTITSTDIIYSPNTMWGSCFEMGYSWKINDRLKWDSGIYFYYQLRHSSPSVYYIDYKTSLGLNTGIYLTFN